MSGPSSRLRVLRIDSNGSARPSLGAIRDTEIQTGLGPGPVSVPDAFSEFDAVVVSVDSAAGLQIMADICPRPGAPPVIGHATSGFEGKPPEHVLLLAELRGAAATIAGPADAGEIARVIKAVVARHRPPPAAA